MLVLTQRIGETLMIADDVQVTILGIKGKQVRIGIGAPRSVITQLIPQNNEMPVGMDSQLTPQASARVVQKLNNRPRKCLDYRTPREVFFNVRTVALQM